MNRYQKTCDGAWDTINTRPKHGICIDWPSDAIMHNSSSFSFQPSIEQTRNNEGKNSCLVGVNDSKQLLMWSLPFYWKPYRPQTQSAVFYKSAVTVFKSCMIQTTPTCVYITLCFGCSNERGYHMSSCVQSDESSEQGMCPAPLLSALSHNAGYH